MSIHLQPLTRRRFIAAAAASVPGLMSLRYLHAADRDPNLFALLSDTHVPERPDIPARGVNMTENFQRVAAELVAHPQSPAAVLINGDCAYLKGLPADYANLAGLLDPLRAAGLPVHLNLGNHDHREQIIQSLAKYRPADQPVPGRRITVLQTERVNWFMLDTLDKVNVTPGLLGEPQIKWLGEALDAHADKPAIIYAHHDPVFKLPEGRRNTGLVDTDAFFNVIAPRRHVKAYVFGHTHRWEHHERDGIHLINLPPTAYVFRKDLPNGWVAAAVKPDGIKMTLHTLDKDHKQDGEVVDLKWRA
ncbi:hypothetical protein HED60_05900 [Planctomycetales bacterium ZRK34]|nr:hypothetical protein HED60_05900 [Planctomycetales bacterium ZRK34]